MILIQQILNNYYGPSPDRGNGEIVVDKTLRQSSL